MGELLINGSLIPEKIRFWTGNINTVGLCLEKITIALQNKYSVINTIKMRNLNCTELYIFYKLTFIHSKVSNGYFLSICANFFHYGNGFSIE